MIKIYSHIIGMILRRDNKDNRIRKDINKRTEINQDIFKGF